MDEKTPKKIHQILDIKAALIAALVSGLVFFLLNLLLSQVAVGSSWVYIRVIASIVMGEGILPPPASFDISIFLISLILHLLISVIFALMIDLAIYRWGLIIGFLGGGLLGLSLYVINFYALSYFFPWFFPYRSWVMVVSHIVFGALAGGIYELLEVEEFVADDK